MNWNGSVGAGSFIPSVASVDWSVVAENIVGMWTKMAEQYTRFDVEWHLTEISVNSIVWK